VKEIRQIILMPNQLSHIFYFVLLFLSPSLLATILLLPFLLLFVPFLSLQVFVRAPCYVGNIAMNRNRNDSCTSGGYGQIEVQTLMK
jgi:hypothetical protein